MAQVRQTYMRQTYWHYSDVDTRAFDCAALRRTMLTLLACAVLCCVLQCYEP